MEMTLLLLLLAAGWFWLDSVHKREIAIDAGRLAAQRCGLQFLDDTVALSQLRLGRDARGRLRWRRTYSFEVSDTGADRLACSVILLGKHPESTLMPPYRDHVIPLHFH